MKRREFVSLVGGAAAWPLAARAQQAGRLPTIGFLGADATIWNPWTAAFVQRLRELGWIEGRTITIEYRWNEGQPERTADIATEFVRLKVDAIVSNALAIPTLKQATSLIPIIFVIAPHPLGGHLVESLARPGGNITGLSVQAADAADKRLELFRAIVPNLRQLAILFNADFSETVLQADSVQAAARTLGLGATRLEIRRAADIPVAFSALESDEDGLFVIGDALIISNLTRIITYALTKRLPTSFNTRDFVQAGGLMSYGPEFTAIFRRGAEYVDKILRGAKPGDLPVEQPTKFDLAINLTTARALGLTIPESFLSLADEVIE